MFRPAVFAPIAAGLLAAAVMPTAAVPTAAAGVIRHDTADSLYTVRADADPTNDLAAVGRWSGGQTSGTFIGTNALGESWVLTAVHIGTVRDIALGGANYAVAEQIDRDDYPGFRNLEDGGDLKLVRLDRTVAGVAPIGYSARTDEVGRTGITSGFGATGTGYTGATQSGGTFRSGTNVLDATGSAIVDDSGNSWDDRLLLADFDAPASADVNDPDNAGWDGVDNQLGPLGSDADPLPTESMFAGGDSGAGLFIDFGDGLGPVLAGINSFVFDERPDAKLADLGFYGDGFGVTRVSGYADWIFENTGIAAINAAAVPEPAAPALLGLAALAGLARRRRSRLIFGFRPNAARGTAVGGNLGA